MNDIIDTALIASVSRAEQLIFGRPLLERNLILCQRAGIKRFFIKATADQRPRVLPALGRFRGHPQVFFVESFERLWQKATALAPGSECIALNGNIVFGASHLKRLISKGRAQPGVLVHIAGAGDGNKASLAAGSLLELTTYLGGESVAGTPSDAELPYALNGRPEDREEAELRVARTMRQETVHSDGLMARLFDRRLSWRISYRLAHTLITPNQVTLGNTALGLLSALMMAWPGYWIRVAASLLFLLSVTIDGVDGELARLRLSESPSGARLDVMTDNLVHVALFIGLIVGCYRAGGGAANFYLLGILLAGFALCAVTINWAMRASKTTKVWMDQVDRITGRDFAYIVVLVAFLNHLQALVWAIAFGTWIFAIFLWIATTRRLGRMATSPLRQEQGLFAEEI